MTRFKARYDGKGMVTLHCPRCNTYESSTRLDRVDDCARIHDKWWHGESIRLPWHEGEHLVVYEFLHQKDSHGRPDWRRLA